MKNEDVDKGRPQGGDPRNYTKFHPSHDRSQCYFVVGSSIVSGPSLSAPPRRIHMLRRLLALSVLTSVCLVVFAGHKGLSKIPAARSVDSASVLDANLPRQSQFLLPREKEIELALKAAPVHLRNEATVYTFGKSGYEKVRAGANGFNCLVNRDGTQNGAPSVYPTCWDPEGSRTILPVMLRVGELLVQQKSAAEIKRDIDRGC